MSLLNTRGDDLTIVRWRVVQEVDEECESSSPGASQRSSDIGDVLTYVINRKQYTGLVRKALPLLLPQEDRLAVCGNAALQVPNHREDHWKNMS